MHRVCSGHDSLEQQLFISDVSGGHKHQGPHGTLRVVQQSWMLVVPVVVNMWNNNNTLIQYNNKINTTLINACTTNNCNNYAFGSCITYPRPLSYHLRAQIDINVFSKIQKFLGAVSLSFHINMYCTEQLLV